MIKEELLQSVLKKMGSHSSIKSAVLRIESGDDKFSWVGATGEMKEEDYFFIASVTKLFVTAVVMGLIEEGRIRLDDLISNHLPEKYWESIHVFKGVDYSPELKVLHLISNTSGLPDYFFHKQDNGRTVADELMEGKDEPWDLERTIDLVKNLRPKFKPGKKGKAAYSDTNYQLLGKVIENITGKPIAEVFQERIFSKLNIDNTYVYSDVKDQRPVPFYFKERKLLLPNYMTSIAVEGGIVSTTEDLMTFLKAFFKWHFFPKENIEDLKKWNLLLPPPGIFYFGVGLEKLYTPRITSPAKPIKEVLGFWGQTGSFAFYNPQTDLFFCGTTNQINGKGHQYAGSAMAKIIKTIL